jgi:hypothetical protein
MSQLGDAPWRRLPRPARSGGGRRALHRWQLSISTATAISTWWWRAAQVANDRAERADPPSLTLQRPRPAAAGYTSCRPLRCGAPGASSGGTALGRHTPSAPSRDGCQASNSRSDNPISQRPILSPGQPRSIIARKSRLSVLFGGDHSRDDRRFLAAGRSSTSRDVLEVEAAVER